MISIKTEHGIIHVNHDGSSGSWAWCAYHDDYDGPGNSRIAYGATKDEAIAELFTILDRLELEDSGRSTYFDLDGDEMGSRECCGYGDDE